MIFSIAPAVAPIIGGWAHVAFGWRAVFAFMVICGVMFAFAAWWRLPETHPLAARIPFNARNLVSTSLTVLRHPEFLMLAFAAAINFCSIAVFIGAAPAIVEKHWGMSETSYWLLFLPVIARHPRRRHGARAASPARLDLVSQVRIGFGITFTVALVRVILHLALDDRADPAAAGAAVRRRARRAVRVSGADAAHARPVSRRRAAPRLRRSPSWRC